MGPYRQFWIHLIARAVVGFVWVYHGVVPKLIFLHADELTILRDAGVAVESAPTMVFWIGWAEVVMGLWVWLGIPSARWPFFVTIVFGIGTTIGAAIQSPDFLIAAFNPVSLNVLFIALSLIGLMSERKAEVSP